MKAVYEATVKIRVEEEMVDAEELSASKEHIDAFVKEAISDCFISSNKRIEIDSTHDIDCEL